MISRLNDANLLKAVPSFMAATHYNRAQLALSRLENPLRIELPNMRGLDIIIDHEAWVCVDRTIGDFPTMAWTGFEASKREGLHRPVPCQLRLFHNHADLICGSVLELTYRKLGERLDNIRPRQFAGVTYLRRTISNR